MGNDETGRISRRLRLIINFFGDF